MKKVKPTVSIIIPVYNEIQTVNTLLKKVYAHKSKLFNKEIIIIESNSNDGTKEVVQKFVKGKKNIRVFYEPYPQGKSSALVLGFKKAIGEIILIQDADLEYKVSDYDRLVKPLIKDRVQFVLGSRHLTKKKKFRLRIRKFKGFHTISAFIMNFAVKFIDILFNLLYETNLTDPNTMYKVFKRRLLSEIKLEGKFFEVDLELVAKFVRRGHVPVEVPVSYESRSHKEGKKIKILRDGFRAIKTVVKYRFIPLESL